MKKLSLILLIALLAFCNAAFARVVTTTGVGATAVEAENDALRNAVENAVGTLIDSQTLVDKAVVLEDTIYASSRGYVQHYDVLERHNTGNGWQVTVRADVDTEPNSKLMDALTRERLISVNMRNAKIAVIIPQEHLRYEVPAQTGETAVVKKFLAAGFQNIIDVSSERLKYNQPFNLDSDQLESVASSMQADILIVGKAFSEGAGDVGKFINGYNTGVVSCKARLEAKMYIARTGQIIAADGAIGAGADITEAVAAQKALADAGAQMGDYLVEQVLNMYSGNKQLLEVTVLATNVNAINKVKQALGSVPGVKSVNFNSYNNGRGVLSVQYSGAPQTLYDYLQRNMEETVVLQESTFNTLTILVR